jgi:hemerythrin
MGLGMAFFEWSDKYSVGVLSIDGQHKRLIEIINILYDAMRAGQGEFVLGKTLDDLVDYTKTHFRFEENLMQTKGYPDLAAHRKMHEGLTTQVWELAHQYKSGKTTLSIQTGNFLKSWLTNHILNTDMKYSEHLVARGAR